MPSPTADHFLNVNNLSQCTSTQVTSCQVERPQPDFIIESNPPGPSSSLMVGQHQQNTTDDVQLLHPTSLPISINTAPSVDVAMMSGPDDEIPLLSDEGNSINCF